MATTPLLLLLLLFLSLLLLSSLSLSGAHIDRSSSSYPLLASNKKEFDYFTLALQWPGTYCRTTKTCCPTNGCCLESGPLNYFTIHGLWPDYNDGTWPSCCTKTYFDLDKVSSLLETLQNYWPSLTCSTSSNCHGGKGLFWAHEWEKHGTCSSPVINDEYSYFTTVLDLYSKYNVTKVLYDAGFLASNAETYAVGEVIAAIKNAFGVYPQLICTKGSIEEIRICFNKKLQPIECGAGTNILRSSSSCPVYISLPTYNSPVAGDKNTKVTWLPTDEAFGALSKLWII